MEQWLKQFQHLARLKAMSPERQLDLMAILLKNKAWDWFSSQPEETTIEVLKAAFRKQFGPQLKASTYAAQLSKTKQGPGQRVSTYLVELAHMSHFKKRINLSCSITGPTWHNKAIHGCESTHKHGWTSDPWYWRYAVYRDTGTNCSSASNCT